MDVMVTGAGGFIGSHLVTSQLNQGRRVRALDLHLERLEPLAGHDRLQRVQGSITDETLVNQALSGVELVFHLASAHLDVSLPDAVYERVNVTASAALVRAAARADVRRLVHVSSVGVIGNVRRPPADETTLCQPTNIYEKTKLAGERVALRTASETGLSLVVVRPAWVYGPACPRTEKLFRQVRRGRLPLFGRGENLRHPLYVGDAVHGLERAATGGSSGEIYILAGPRPVTSAELIQAVARVCGAPMPGLRLPLALGLAGGAVLELAFRPLRRPPPFSRRSVDFFARDNAYSIDRARRELGFEPVTDLPTGLEATYAWLVDAGHL